MSTEINYTLINGDSIDWDALRSIDPFRLWLLGELAGAHIDLRIQARLALLDLDTHADAVHSDVQRYIRNEARRMRANVLMEIRGYGYTFRKNPRGDVIASWEGPTVSQDVISWSTP